MLAQIKSLFRPRNKQYNKSGTTPPSNQNNHKQKLDASTLRVISAGGENKQPGHKRLGKVKEPKALPSPDTIVTQWIEDERRRKSKVPIYPGLENYEIVKKLGDGAFSNVYKARDVRTGRRVAIKVVRKLGRSPHESGKSHLHPNMQQKPKATERANVLREVQIMASLKHPNIVQLVELTESKDYYYLVLELCEGGELFHSICKLTFLSEDLSRHVICQVAEAVRYLHEERGIVHRDIKPENILFDPIPFVPSPPQQRVDGTVQTCGKADEGVFVKGIGGGGIGRVKLADFGLSKVIWDSTTYTPCGTVGYTAPEVVRDQRYSKAVDMWAMGCVLYTMLCGYPPFYDESIPALTEKVAQGIYTFQSPWWDPISDAAKDLVARLLCVDPNRRCTITDFLAHPWVTGRPFFYTRVSSVDSFYHHVSPATTIDLESPGSSLRRKDVFSPGVPSIKEILDITYAVQRMGEEQTWRGAVARGFQRPEYDETPEEEQDRLLVQSYMTRGQTHNDSASNASSGLKYGTPTSPTSSCPPPSPAQTRNNTGGSGFQLNMENATLLKNRRVTPPHTQPAVVCS